MIRFRQPHCDLSLSRFQLESPSESTTLRPALEDALDEDELDEYLLSPSEVPFYAK